MRRPGIFSCLIVFITLLFLTAEAGADVLHYNNILIGDRATGMGGAFTAVSDDPSGLYYNPAGIVYSFGSNLSASANAFHSSAKDYKGALGGYTWERNAFSMLPNFFGVVQSLGRGKAGLSYVVPDSVIEDQDQTFYYVTPAITGYTINFNNEDKSFLIGPSYALEIREGLSTGATLYFHYRRHQWILNQYIEYTSGNTRWANTYFESEEWGIMPVVGLMWSPADKVSLGLSLSKVQVLDSETTQQDITYSATDVPPTSRKVLGTGDKREYPLTATIGGAYFFSNSLLFSADVSYHSSAEDDFYGAREEVWNFAAGTEYYLSSSFALRGGLFTNFSSAPEVRTGGTDQPEHVDLYGGSLSAGYFTRGASLSLGVSYSRGTGEAQIIDGDPGIQDLEMETWTVFLSTSYNY